MKRTAVAYWSRFVRLSWRRQAWVVFAVAFLLRFGYVCGTGRLGAPPPVYSEQVRIARYVVHGTGFVSPVGPERDDPSSWYVPGYVGMIAAAFWTLGEDSFAALAAIRIINLVAQAGAVAIWVVIGRFLLGRRAAGLAAVFMVLSPAISLKAAEIWDTFPAMLAGAICLAMFAVLRPQRGWSQMAAGAVCGAAAMINPCFSLCCLVWFVWNLWHSGSAARDPRRFLLRAVAGLLGFIVVILPWTVRNRVVFGEWFYLRSNLGLELWVGNAPWSDGYFFSRDGRCIHPVFDPAEADRLVQRGEFGYFQDRMQEFKGWLGEDPLRVLGLAWRRVKWFWLGRFADQLSPAWWVLKLMGFAVPGVLALAGGVYALLRRPRAYILVATLLIFPVPYYLSVMMVRYRLPLEPLLLLMAALFVTELSRGIRRRKP